MIVTIDGPAGAGKSTAARLLARRLGFAFLDTGAMYRAVALAAARANLDPADGPSMERLLGSIQLELPADRVILNGEDVTHAIRATEITALSAPVANSATVRACLVQWQRRLAQGRSIVCEGRDQGTIVFPDAGCKFFLEADASERAARRHRELAARGTAPNLGEILTAQLDRDKRDRERVIAPMIPAADAIHIDSTHLSIEAVVDQMETTVRERMQNE